jgi:hypothetical protein
MIVVMMRWHKVVLRQGLISGVDGIMVFKCDILMLLMLHKQCWIGVSQRAV